MTSARLAPLSVEAQEPTIRELLERLGGPAGTPNLYTTLARHEVLFRRWLSFGATLLHGTLPARARELLILRTAWHCRSEYEFGQHTVIGREAGLSDEEIRNTTLDPDSVGWTATDATIMRAADDLHRQATLSDECWELLRATYDDSQLIELVMVVGQYHLVAFCANGLGISRDEGTPGFPTRCPRSQ